MNSKKDSVVRAGVGVILIKGNKVLLGKRNSDPDKADSKLKGEGEWTMPGGKIDFGEKYMDTAQREVKEETGIEIDKEKTELITVNDDIVDDSHFVTLGLHSPNFDGEPEVKEPDQFDEWRWFNLAELPDKLFSPSKKILDEFLNDADNFNKIDIKPEKTIEQDYDLSKDTVFASIPSRMFYSRAKISSFILNKGKVPLNPYMNFDYNLLNSVNKEVIKASTNNLIKRSDELWVFEDNIDYLPDGVVNEITIAKELDKKIRFFNLPDFEQKNDKINIGLERDTIESYYGYQLRDVDRKVVYTAMSSKMFYYRTFASKYALENQKIPLNCFLSFDYFLLDQVDRKEIIQANYNLINMSDELWVIEPISDGIIPEIKLAKKKEIPIRYFTIEDSSLKEIDRDKANYEQEITEKVNLMINSAHSASNYPK